MYGFTHLKVHKFHDQLSLMFDAIMNLYFCHHAGWWIISIMLRLTYHHVQMLQKYLVYLTLPWKGKNSCTNSTRCIIQCINDYNILMKKIELHVDYSITKKKLSPIYLMINCNDFTIVMDLKCNWLIGHFLCIYRTQMCQRETKLSPIYSKIRCNKFTIVID